MNIYLDDSKCKEQLRPFSLTSSVADFRVGILTIREKWEALQGIAVYSDVATLPKDVIYVNSNYLPTKDNYLEIIKYAQDKVAIMETDDVKVLSWPWQIFEYNGWAIQKDFELLALADNRKNEEGINPFFGSHPIYIHESATVLQSSINSTDGPVYIGEGAIVMEGCMLRGPLAVCKNAVVKMGAKIYGATTLGESCVAGGEIKNSVLFGFSNKAHDGYLGDSVLGYWCNVGAGSSNSNIKNTVSTVSYNLTGKEVINAESIKGGLLMGDYSRCTINTAFTTAAVVEPSCHILGTEKSLNFYSAFTWGTERYKLEEAIKHINAWKALKGKEITDREIETLTTLYNQ